MKLLDFGTFPVNVVGIDTFPSLFSWFAAVSGRDLGFKDSFWLFSCFVWFVGWIHDLFLLYGAAPEGFLGNCSISGVTLDLRVVSAEPLDPAELFGNFLDLESVFGAIFDIFWDPKVATTRSLGNNSISRLLLLLLFDCWGFTRPVEVWDEVLFPLTTFWGYFENFIPSAASDVWSLCTKFVSWLSLRSGVASGDFANTGESSGGISGRFKGSSTAPGNFSENVFVFEVISWRSVFAAPKLKKCVLNLKKIFHGLTTSEKWGENWCFIAKDYPHKKSNRLNRHCIKNEDFR